MDTQPPLLDWNADFLQASAPRTYLVVAPRVAFERIFYGRSLTASDPYEVHRIIRGAQCRSKAGLFDEFQAVLQFPYFGRGWDAFDDLITDLEWIHASSFVIGITDAQAVLEEDSEGFKIFMDIIKRASAEWATPNPTQDERRPLPFTVVFNAESAHSAATMERLDDGKGEVALRRIELPEDSG